MTYIKLIFVLLFPLTLFSQRKLRDSIIVKNTVFKIMYSEKLQQPLQVEYRATCYNGKVSRALMDFYTNDSIITSNDADYLHNIYDKGHMAPAADFNCDKKSLHETFSYLNCALQHQDLNRGTWKTLEEYERNLIKTKGPIKVKIVIEFKKPSKVLSTGATIPSGFFKYITVEKTNEVYSFYMPNITPTSQNIFSYSLKKF